jgi:putative ABC transport system permease protein
MLSSYFITSLRHFRKQFSYTLINIIGLSVGIACSLLIFLWVQDELSVDQFHANGSRLYRAMRHAHFSDGSTFTWAAMPKPLAQLLEEEYPEILEAELFSWEEQLLIAQEDQAFKEKGHHAGKDFFTIFTYPFLEGDPNTALEDVNSIVILERLAQKLYGEESALGKIVKVDNRAEFKITGVIENVPEDASIRFDFILPIEELLQRNEWVESWDNNALRILVLLDENASPTAVNNKIRNIINEHTEHNENALFLQPYEDMYLYADYEDGKLVGGRIEYVRIFSIVAIFVLIIACINFMNLATARASKRAKEVGVRKAIGARQTSLVIQFMLDSFLIVWIGTLLSLLLVVLVLPYFNEVTAKTITLDLTHPTILLTLLGILLMTSLLAGSYPALYMSSMNTIKILKGALKHGKQATLFRRSLVVVQFVISILLIIGTVVIYQQIHYIQQKNLGLERENLLFMPIEGALKANYETFKTELLQKPGIQLVTGSNQNPLNIGNSTGGLEWEGKNPEDNILFSFAQVDYDYLETMDMQLVAGRTFSRDFATDTANIVINEEAARVMGMENPVGEDIHLWSEIKGKVIGVVKDFHFSSMHEEIGPFIMILSPKKTEIAFVRAEKGKTQEAVASMEEVSSLLNPSFPFEYHFMDEDFEKIYRSEMTIGKLASSFALIAIFVSCLGLLGLASYTAEQRIKEISVRKVMGASVANLVLLLSGEFTRLVLVGFILAVPIAYSLMDQWLEAFAYHIDLSFVIFLLAGVTSLVLAWCTVGYQSFRAARCNPADILRND